MEKVIRSWWYARCTGSCAMYSSESCIQPMFHFRPKPRPPKPDGPTWWVARVTPSQAVDSSAMVTTPGTRR